METLKVIKIGGQVIDDPERLERTLMQFAHIPGKKILVHGGGKMASHFARRLGVEPKMVNGRRVTDAQTLQIVQMVYAGLINTTIVARLQALKVDALGLNGADANSILSVRRAVGAIDFGFVGDVQQVRVSFLQALLSQGIVPVFCALTHDGRGQILNTNADTVASELAVALSRLFATELIFTFEKNGVLGDVHDENSVINHLTFQDYARLKANGIFSDGMIPKLDNAFRSLRSGVQKVRILSASALEAVTKESTIGTTITLE